MYSVNSVHENSSEKASEHSEEDAPAAACEDQGETSEDGFEDL